MRYPAGNFVGGRWAFVIWEAEVAPVRWVRGNRVWLLVKREHAFGP